MSLWISTPALLPNTEMTEKVKNTKADGSTFIGFLFFYAAGKVSLRLRSLHTSDKVKRFLIDAAAVAFILLAEKAVASLLVFFAS